jgi:prolyl-tRNA editing enzyme YbaK/EbsC (Cys-tRNA(Pro) deacylase)
MTRSGKIGGMDEIEERVRASASATGVAFEVRPCDPDLADTAAFCEAYGYTLDQSANTIMVIGKTEPPLYAACVVLATHRLDVNGAVRRRFGVRKASFAPAEATIELTGMTPGGVTPFALPDGLPLWIDAAVMRCGEVVVGGGSRSMKVLCPPAALAALPNAEVIDDLANPIA